MLLSSFVPAARDVEDIADLSILDSVALFLPTLVVSAMALLRRTRPKLRRHRFSRHHLVAPAIFLWGLTVTLLAFFIDGNDSTRVILLLPINLINYGLVGTLDILVAPFMLNSDLRQRVHIPFGKTQSGVSMPGLAQWNMMYTSRQYIRIPLTLFFTVLILSVNGAFIYLMILRSAYVPLVGVIVGLILTLTATHPSANVPPDQTVIRDSPQGVLIHSMTPQEFTRAFVVSFREGKNVRKNKVSLLMFQDAASKLSYVMQWDRRKDETEGERFTRLFPVSSHRIVLEDDGEGLITTARSLTAFMRSRYGSNEWADGQLDSALRNHILTGDVIRAVSTATIGLTDVDLNDLTWLMQDNAIDLYAAFVLMHVHAMVEGRISVALDERGENALPFFVAAMEPKYYGANEATHVWQKEYDGAPAEWKLSNSQIQKPDCRLELGVIGTTPEIFFKTQSDEETNHMIKLYERMAVHTDSTWIRIYSCCLYLIRTGRVSAKRKWKGEDAQHLITRIEDPVYMSRQLESIMLTQFAYSAIIAVKAWLPGRGEL